MSAASVLREGVAGFKGGNTHSLAVGMDIGVLSS